MKGGGGGGGGGKKRNGGSEVGVVPNEAVAGGGVGAGGLLAEPLGEKDQTQKGKDQVQDASAVAAAEGVEEEAEEDEEGEVEEDGALADDDAAAERPKLDEGFYEIEAIRRKRVRKGQLQYLIKWRGWPEAANTWEPLENLQSCSDVIEAFEDSLRSGKHRKRKRKHGTPNSQPKKKQQHSTISAYDVEIGIVGETVKTAPPKRSSLSDLRAATQSTHEGYNNGDIKNLETAKQVGVENGCGNICQQMDNSKDGNEYDPKLSELKTTTFASEVNMDKLAIDFEEAKASEGGASVDGVSRANCVEPVQSNRRTGAKRRKSGSVKRFKQDSCASEPVITHYANSRTRSGGSAGRGQVPGTGNPGFPGGNSGGRNGNDGFKNASNIIRIVRPMGYSASVSNNIQDVVVTFMAMRSDGSEVLVDNKFLKANNPLLLINFYEQHLRYSPTPSLDRGIDGE